MEQENVFKIGATYSKVREFLATEGWELEGNDVEMDSFRNKSTG